MMTKRDEALILANAQSAATQKEGGRVYAVKASTHGHSESAKARRSGSREEHADHPHSMRGQI